ncbi:hypothetical protein GCM10011495_38830 [Hymenobacter frigidus]|uniref:Uncharacterized protein n=1 Tax=Hymenobacter frigidus TaxID=1524095 RepID=A0ABQ2AH25_9BACT|nr:hypothetical protein GCM10011495_38830 [Hymenobacter frigidus]
MIYGCGSLQGREARAVTSALATVVYNTAFTTKESTDLLTVKETAKGLRKSEKTIREYVKPQVLPAADANRNTA